MAYTRQQWLTLVVFAIADFCSAVCVSLQAPFYPKLAESKGATPTQYGFVFGIFELLVFIICPIYGNFINEIGPKFMFNAGIFTTAITCILFGFLDRVEDPDTFIGLSLAIRIVEALGDAGFLTASFSIIAKEFPDSVGTTFASLETCFGLGMIVGPTVGGALFEFGGFILPFAVMGCTLLFAAFLTYCILPAHEDFKSEGKSTGNLIHLMKIPSVSIAAYAILASSISIGFLQTTLEPHLRPFGLSPFKMGLMFVLNGAAYAVFAPLWGWLSDRKFNPRSLVIFGAVVISVSFMMIGPAPYFQAQTITLPIGIAALVLHGTGFGAALVATFTSAHKDAIANGFPDDIQTYGLVSGMWTSTFALGAFIGPSVAGVLFEYIGFPWATQFVVALHLLVVLLFVIYACWCEKRYKSHANIYRRIHESLSYHHSETCYLLAIPIPKKHQEPLVYDSSYGSSSSASSGDYVY